MQDGRVDVYGSQSIEDNNEGFDVTINEQDGACRHQVLDSRPEGDTTDCEGSTELRMGWAGRWGTPW